MPVPPWRAGAATARTPPISQSATNGAAVPDDAYVPPPDGGEWEWSEPQRAGFDPNRLDQAIAFARERETPWPRDLRAHIEGGYFDRPPHNELFGPDPPRGAPNGLFLRHGRVVGTWGDTRQVDFTFSVAKSYLSLLAGIAVADGLIGDLDEPVGRTVDDGGFDGQHNGAITWRHLLQHTSEWSGTLFGKSDVIDRNRSLAIEGAGPAKGERRDAAAAGDVLGIQRRAGEPAQPGAAAPIWPAAAGRVRRADHAPDRRLGGLALAWLSHLVRRDRRAAGPVGGRRHALGRRRGHPCRGPGTHRPADAATRKLGRSAGVSDEWVAAVGDALRTAIRPMGCCGGSTPGGCAIRTSDESFFAFGAGGNITWIDPAHDLVAVMRWIDPDGIDAFMGKVTAALSGG